MFKKKKVEKEVLAEPKLELVLAKLDSLSARMEVINERLSSLEKIVKEIYELAKS